MPLSRRLYDARATAVLLNPTQLPPRPATDIYFPLQALSIYQHNQHVSRWSVVASCYPNVRALTLHPYPILAEKRVAAGLKAAIHNPNVSDEAKARAQERLDDMIGNNSGGGTTARATDANGHELNRVLGGYKATLHSEQPPSLLSG